MYTHIYMCVCVLIRCSHHVPIHPFLMRWKGYSEAYGSVYYDSWRAVVCVTMRECCKQISVCRLLTARQSPPPFFWVLDWIDWRRATIWVLSRFANWQRDWDQSGPQSWRCRVQTGPVVSRRKCGRLRHKKTRVVGCALWAGGFVWCCTLLRSCHIVSPFKPDPSHWGGCAPAPAHFSHRALRVLSLPEQWQRLHRPHPVH